MLLIIGSIILIITVYFLMKQGEPRLVMFLGGFAMAIAAGDPFATFRAFSESMKQATLFESIVSAMGFAMVLKATECDKHLIYLLTKWLRRAGPLLIPGAMLATFFVNTAITSAAGCSAAVGAILIPFLMSAGIHPVIAASAVYAGTFGGNLNPGYGPIGVVATVSKTTPMAVINNHFWPLMAAALVAAFSLYLMARLFKENSGYEVAGYDQAEIYGFKVDYLRAIVPIVPLALLIVVAKGYVPFVKSLAISHSMIIGVFLAFAVTRTNPTTLSKEFWRGVGDAFGFIFGMITCALILVEGMKSAGVVDAAIKAMISHPEIAKIVGTFGTMFLGAISGSGDGASVAFNNAVTVNAAQFGLEPMSLGSLSALGGALGRTMSPVAGAAWICATYAGVTPMEMMKRNAPGMIAAALLLMVLL